jgi:hypothetical protein
MGKKRPLGLLSAVGKFNKMRDLIQLHNKEFYPTIAHITFQRALVNICVEYKVPPTIKPQNMNDFAREVLKAVKAKHEITAD